MLAVAANHAAAGLCRESAAAPAPDNRGTIVPIHSWFAGLVAALWPERQRAKMLRFITGIRSERTARAWASKKEPRAWVLALLLRSDHGWRVLSYIMRGSTATWWLNVQHGLRLAEAIKQAEAQ